MAAVLLMSLWWLVQSHYYQVPTKSDLRGVARYIATLEKESGPMLLATTESPERTRLRGHNSYYWTNYNIRSDLLRLNTGDTVEESFARIYSTLLERDLDVLVLFSQHVEHSEFSSLVQISQKRLGQAEIVNFTGFSPGATFVAVFKLDGLPRLN
jgi:hypothetical protein